MGRTNLKKNAAETAREMFEQLNLKILRALGELVSVNPPKRKSELTPLFIELMTNPVRVRELYSGLDAIADNSVSNSVI